MARVNRPGPKGTSCLTCKQRHKKCDQRVPTCERCEKGGFDCLGYEHNSEKRFPIHFLRPKSPLTVPRPHEIGGTECSKEVPEGSLLQEGLLETIPTTSAPSVAAHMDICVTRVMRSSRTTKPNADTYPWRAGDLSLWVV
ncbi:hypothetical protein B0J17DRAFT_411633 [Rhizoctonia solani]|nr:hypothetical protein B0J17DRAFT_411633 [Rhizoctonia solani]